MKTTISKAWVDEFGTLFVELEDRRCLCPNGFYLPEAIRKRMPNVTGLKRRGLRKDAKITSAAKINSKEYPFRVVNSLDPYAPTYCQDYSLAFDECERLRGTGATAHIEEMTLDITGEKWERVKEYRTEKDDDGNINLLGGSA